MFQLWNSETLLPGGGLGQHLQDAAQQVVEALPPQAYALRRASGAGPPPRPAPTPRAARGPAGGGRRAPAAGPSAQAQRSWSQSHRRGSRRGVPLVHAAHKGQLAAAPPEHAHHVAQRLCETLTVDLHPHLVPREGHPVVQAALDLDGAVVLIARWDGGPPLEGLLLQSAAVVPRAMPAKQFCSVARCRFTYCCIGQGDKGLAKVSSSPSSQTATVTLRVPSRSSRRVELSAQGSPAPPLGWGPRPPLPQSSLLVGPSAASGPGSAPPAPETGPRGGCCDALRTHRGSSSRAGCRPRGSGGPRRHPRPPPGTGHG